MMHNRKNRGAAVMAAAVAVLLSGATAAGDVVASERGGLYEFEGWGVLELDATEWCVVFQSFPFYLILEDYGSFEVGESVYVKGYYESCLSFCSINGCLADNCISQSPEACAFCPWDLDDDGVVGVTDFLGLLAEWGTDPFGAPDFDGDCEVGVTDFLVLLANWGPCL